MKDELCDLTALIVQFQTMIDDCVKGQIVDDAALAYLAHRIYNFTVVHATIPLHPSQAKALNILVSIPDHPALRNVSLLAQGASQMYARLTSPLPNTAPNLANAQIDTPPILELSAVTDAEPPLTAIVQEQTADIERRGVGFQLPPSDL